MKTEDIWDNQIRTGLRTLFLYFQPSDYLQAWGAEILHLEPILWILNLELGRKRDRDKQVAEW